MAGELQVLARNTSPMRNVAIRLIAALVAAAVVNTASSAQVTGARVARISGVVRDSATGLPARKAWVCTLIPAGRSAFSSRCGGVDSAGAYRLDSLPAIGLRVSVQCEVIRGMGKWLTSDSIVFADSSLLRRDWAVPTAGCDPRPVRRVIGVLRGHYTPGFESSAFVPCAADAWFIPGDSLDVYTFDARRAWATWPQGVGRGLKWPDAPRDSYGNPRYYVRWRGTVVGPGRYGHLGVSAFEFVVDTVFELRAPGRRDCR